MVYILSFNSGQKERATISGSLYPDTSGVSQGSLLGSLMFYYISTNCHFALDSAKSHYLLMTVNVQRKFLADNNL